MAESLTALTTVLHKSVLTHIVDKISAL